MPAAMTIVYPERIHDSDAAVTSGKSRRMSPNATYSTIVSRLTTNAAAAKTARPAHLRGYGDQSAENVLWRNAFGERVGYLPGVGGRRGIERDQRRDFEERKRRGVEPREVEVCLSQADCGFDELRLARRDPASLAVGVFRDGCHCCPSWRVQLRWA